MTEYSADEHDEPARCVRLCARCQALDQAREQAPDLDLAGALGVQRTRQEPEIPREKEIILKFLVPDWPRVGGVNYSAAAASAYATDL